MLVPRLVLINPKRSVSQRIAKRRQLCRDRGRGEGDKKGSKGENLKRDEVGRFTYGGKPHHHVTFSYLRYHLKEKRSKNTKYFLCATRIEKRETSSFLNTRISKSSLPTSNSSTPSFLRTASADTRKNRRGENEKTREKNREV